MKPILISLAVCVFLLTAAHPGPASNASNDKESMELLSETPFIRQKFTGDLDAMLQRRLIRVLVTHSKTHFFVDKGTKRGLTHDMFVEFDKELNKNLRKGQPRVFVVFVPVARDDLISALVEGRGDIAAANLTITPKRLQLVDFTDPTFTDVKEIVVTGPGAEPLTVIEDLSGREIFVRETSSFHESLQTLNSELERMGKAPVTIRFAPEEFETEDILEMVNAGIYSATIVDNHIAEFWSQVFDRIVPHPEIALRSDAQIGVMVRKDNPQLKAKLNEFLGRFPKGSLSRNLLLQKYLKNTKFVQNATSQEEMAKFNAMIELFSKYGEQYELDYLLVMAQGYQESRLDHSAKSPAGAIGVMQLLPSTGKEMQVGDITKLEPNIHAGVKYVRHIKHIYYADAPMDNLNKMLFTFASYNAGPNRIRQFRREAEKRDLNPNIWFNNVELIAKEKIGRETVRYVSNIFKYYIAYKMIQERDVYRKQLTKEIGH